MPTPPPSPERSRARPPGPCGTSRPAIESDARPSMAGARNAVTNGSSSSQKRDTSDFDIPSSTSALTSSSTFRVDTRVHQLPKPRPMRGPLAGPLMALGADQTRHLALDQTRAAAPGCPHAGCRHPCFRVTRQRTPTDPLSLWPSSQHLRVVFSWQREFTETCARRLRCRLGVAHRTSTTRWNSNRGALVETPAGGAAYMILLARCVSVAHELASWRCVH